MAREMLTPMGMRQRSLLGRYDSMKYKGFIERFGSLFQNYQGVHEKHVYMERRDGV